MSKIPRYRQIAATIRQEIEDGVYKVGNPLPTESKLQQLFLVSRVTVRQAIRLLINEGILESRQGSGTYVCQPKVHYDIYQMTSLEEKLGSHKTVHSKVIRFEIKLADESIAESLNLELEAQVFYVKRVRYIDGMAATLEETWMPVALFPDLTYQVMQGSKYQFIEQEKKLKIDCSEQELAPVMPSDEVSQYLALDPLQPILMKMTRSFLTDGTVFELSRNYFKSSEYKFTLIAKRMSQ